MNIYVKPVECCNLRCMHCYNGEPDTSSLRVSEALKKFLASVVSARHDEENWIIIHGGEPLLASKEQMKDLATMLPECKKRITTNMTMPLSMDRKKLLLAMDDIRTSFDVGVNRFHTPALFTTWVHNIKKMRALGGKLSTLNICLTAPLLKHDPGDVLKLAEYLGFKRLSFEALCVTGRMNEHKSLVPSVKDIDNWFCRMYNELKGKDCDLKVANFEDVRAGILGDWKNYRGKACCDQTITVNADGTIGECPNSARIKHIGTIKDDPAAVIQHKCNGCNIEHLKTCLACSYYPQCHGGCKEQTWNNGECNYPKKLSDLMKKDIQG